MDDESDQGVMARKRLADCRARATEVRREAEQVEKSSPIRAQLLKAADEWEAIAQRIGSVLPPTRTEMDEAFWDSYGHGAPLPSGTDPGGDGLGLGLLPCCCCGDPDRMADHPSR